MKQVTMYMTDDGKVHQDKRAALKHVEARYADKLLPLANKLAQIDKYIAMSEFIDSNLALFLELHAIKQDMQEIEEHEED